MLMLKKADVGQRSGVYAAGGKRGVIVGEAGVLPAGIRPMGRFLRRGGGGVIVTWITY